VRPVTTASGIAAAVTDSGFPIKEIVFPVVFLAMVACVAYSAFLFLKMIRDINKAEGRPGRIPLFTFCGGWYFLHGHSRACPDDVGIRVLYMLLPAMAGVLFLLLCALW
jgi:hypothetical protein